MEGLLSMAKKHQPFRQVPLQNIRNWNSSSRLLDVVLPGYKPEHVAPLFRKAILLPKRHTSRTFWEYYLYTEYWG
jgi:hypothetical protein